MNLDIVSDFDIRISNFLYSPTIQNLINEFCKFPAVGPRTAGRFVFYLIKSEQKKIDDLITAINNLKNKVKLCAFCGKSFENEEQHSDLCAICSDPRRDKTVVCVVGKEIDLETIERTKQFAGLYFIWSAKSEEQQLKKIIGRIKKEPLKEIILALNPTLEGRQSSLKIQRNLQELGIKITQLGRGLPLGGEIEYADEETITSALEGRK